jgi:transcriptional regulator with XRE-family HTH domain
MSSTSKPFFLGPLYADGMTIGKRIRQLRLSKSLTQDQLGELCNTTKGAVSQWESDLTMPTLSNILLLGEKLTFTMDWLLRGVGNHDDPYPKSESNAMIAAEPDAHHKLEEELLAIVKLMNQRGMFVLIDKAGDLARLYPRDQAKAA